MHVVHGLELVRPFERRPLLTIGNFDGVHLAHQAILRAATCAAAEANAATVVLTFDPHPLTLLTPAVSPPRLTSLDDKLHFLESAGADVVVVARTDAKLLQLEAEDFVDRVIRGQFFPCCVVEGHSFGFGRGRRGDVELLRTRCEAFQCEVRVVPPVLIETEDATSVLVSSSWIRRQLRSGNVPAAANALGRPHRLCGRVEPGDRRGRTLGFPTANLRVDDELVPADGVYAGWAHVDPRTTAESASNRHAAAISIGPAPTFGPNQRRRIEAHLLDFDDDLYGRRVALDFVARVRDQRAFVSSAALVAQIALDLDAIRSALRLASSQPPGVVRA